MAQEGQHGDFKLSRQPGVPRIGSREDTQIALAADRLRDAVPERGGQMCQDLDRPQDALFPSFLCGG